MTAARSTPATFSQVSTASSAPSARAPWALSSRQCTRKLDERVALKSLRPEALANEGLVARFTREARLIGGISVVGGGVIALSAPPSAAKASVGIGPGSISVTGRW